MTQAFRTGKQPWLLAVDAGVRTGLALYGRDGRLKWCRSKNFGSGQALKRGIYTILNDIIAVEWIVVEGGGPFAEAWEREVRRRNLSFLPVVAETWRKALLLPREQASGSRAKESADFLARRVIAWSNAKRPTSLRHDAAEAVLIGLWAVDQCGWLDVPLEDILRLS